jgi:N-acetylglutamate synthase-like GNAT family acetyltransferase
MEIKIRKAKTDDVEPIVSLSKEFGYNPEKSEVENKLNRFNLNLNEAIYVAENDKVIGWMHISLVEPLESSSFVEIRGIVVNQKYRKNGIGTKLIETAEKWAKGKGCKKLRVRTNIIREETRGYYRNLDFISKKTQEVFEKEI